MTRKRTTMPVWELSVPNDGGRAVIVDPAVAEGFNLGLSDAVAQQIRRIEESVVTAEQRLGLFRVG